MRIKNSLTVFFFISLAALITVGCSDEKEEKKVIQQKPTDNRAESLNSNDENTAAAEDFTLNDLQGNAVKLSDYRGQWVVVNYWATWCPPCREEIPYFVKIQEDREDVQILGIAYEDAPVEKLKQFAEEFSVNYPILTLDVYNPPAFAEAAGEVLPTTVFYNPQGQLHKTRIGPIDYDTLQQLTQ